MLLVKADPDEHEMLPPGGSAGDVSEYLGNQRRGNAISDDAACVQAHDAQSATGVGVTLMKLWNHLAESFRALQIGN